MIAATFGIGDAIIVGTLLGIGVALIAAGIRGLRHK